MLEKAEPRGGGRGVCSSCNLARRGTLAGEVCFVVLFLGFLSLCVCMSCQITHFAMVRIRDSCRHVVGWTRRNGITCKSKEEYKTSCHVMCVLAVGGLVRKFHFHLSTSKGTWNATQQQTFATQSYWDRDLIIA